MRMNRWIRGVIGVAILLFAGLIYAWSVLSAPIAVEFPAWTKVQLSLTFTLVMILFCVGMLICGVLTKRVKPCVNLWASAFLFLTGFYIASRAQSLGALYIGFGVMCGLACGLTYNTVMSTIVKWFPDKPGLISGVLLMGFGGGSFLIGKLYQAWTPDAVGGWRISFIVLGLLTAAVLAVFALFIKAPGPDFAMKVGASGGAGSRILSESTPGQTLKSPAFWLYYIWAVALSAGGLALISQAGNMAKEVSSGLAADRIATIVGLISIFNAIGRVLFGGMYDKFGRRVSMQLVNGLFIVAAVILIAALQMRSIALVISGFIVGGLAYSGITPTNSSFIRAYFGAKHYPVNFSLIGTNLIFASFGSTVSGALYDASSSYNSTFFLIIGLAAAGVVCAAGISLIDSKRKK